MRLPTANIYFQFTAVNGHFQQYLYQNTTKPIVGLMFTKLLIHTSYAKFTAAFKH